MGLKDLKLLIRFYVLPHLTLCHVCPADMYTFVFCLPTVLISKQQSGAGEDMKIPSWGSPAGSPVVQRHGWPLAPVSRWSLH